VVVSAVGFVFIRPLILSVSSRGLPHIFLKHHGKVIWGAEAAAIGYFINGIIDKLKVMVDFQQLYDENGSRVLVFEVSPRPMGLPGESLT